jgi:hypothetical protein
VAAGNHYDYGFVVQGSYLVTRSWEVFGRYDWTHLDSGAFDPSRADKEKSFHEITAGVNYFLWKHHAKFTADLSYLPNGVPVDLTGLGYLSSGGNEFVLRGQFTLSL